MDPTVIVLVVVIVVLVIALAAVGILLSRRRHSERLQEHYGPEYERSLIEAGDRQTAEARLVERERRHSELDVRDLDADERERFSASWTTIQRDFVDDPVRAVCAADDLVVDIMRTRGYPVEDAERRTEDVSVEHPGVVQRYREAREIREATDHGEVDLDQQRHAVTSYRLLVEALLGTGSKSPDTTDDHAGGPVDEHGDEHGGGHAEDDGRTGHSDFHPDVEAVPRAAHPGGAHADRTGADRVDTRAGTNGHRNSDVPTTEEKNR